ncbi:hypothetical protein [Pelagimonas varians]|uniref:Uncharacterized protein n=1 Tax=Pelagimonas varians TaxID=696760 RepID=A0A238K8Z0_9RHOB|nr:hypothetical protein [Pelagimonas varians]PYG31599.1 hypothetical protein C8N36_10416 [Pelagimonas varians]SMX38957.1 hypothetical protein PEV8663_01628 [Pelagimonas varians]
MHRQIGFRETTRVLAAAAFWMLVSWNQALAQSCELPSQLSRLVDSLAALPDDEGSISVRTAAQIASLLENIDDQSLVADLRENGLVSLSRLVGDVTNEADRIATSVEVSDARRLNLILRDLNQQTLIACAHAGDAVFEQFEQDSYDGFSSIADLDWQAVNGLLTESKTVGMGVLVTLVGGVVGVLYLIDSGYRMVMALMYNRKACRIPVTLRLGTQTFQATIVTLGRGGCRVHPTDLDEFDDHLAQMRQVPTLFDIDGFVIEANISAIYEDVSDFRFRQNIHLRAQKTLLKLSTISPYYVKKTGKKPTSQEKQLAL